MFCQTALEPTSSNKVKVFLCLHPREMDGWMDGCCNTARGLIQERVCTVKDLYLNSKMYCKVALWIPETFSFIHSLRT